MAIMHGAQRHRGGAANPAVGDQAAEDRRQIDQGRVGAENCRGERLPVNAAEERPRTLSKPTIFSTCPGSSSSRTMYRTSRVCIDNKITLPRLGEGEVAEPPRVAEEIGLGNLRRPKARHHRVRQRRSCGPHINGNIALL